MKVKCKAEISKSWMGESSSAGGERAISAHTGAQRKLQLEKRRYRQNTLQVHIVHIPPPRNTAREQSEFQQFPAEWVGVESKLVGTSSAQFPIRLFPAVVHRDTFNRRVVVDAQAE